MITAHGPIFFFVECKAPGKKPTKLQAKDHEKRRGYGCIVRVIDSKSGADAVIQEIEDYFL